ncbi:hypothetical protein LZ30DRAFT_330624 [Colletotrichum cereale]|nr:hypothetical protein LZ30DRAFT_330624 [Colletotrichum cereale]
MFKTRIKSWGLDKNLKEHEVMHMLQLKQKRDATGKKSEFFVRDQRVDYERLTTYLSRRPDLRNKLLHSLRPEEEQQQEPMRPRLELICRTPSPILETSPLLIGPPDLQHPEEMLRIFRGYFEGAIESVWAIQGKSGCSPKRKTVQLQFNKMHIHMDNAIALLWIGKQDAAFSALNNSLDSLMQSIKDPNPILFYSLAYRTLQLEHTLADSVVMFICNMHATMLGARHPLTLVWSRFRQLPWEVRARVLSLMAINCVQPLEGHLEILTKVMESALGPTTNVLHQQGQLEHQVFHSVLSKYVAASKTYLAQGDYPTYCKSLLGMAGVQLWAQQYDQARDALVQAYSLIQDSRTGTGDLRAELELSYYEVIGRLYYKTGPIDEAIHYARRAYDCATDNFPPGGVRSLRAIQNLIHLYHHDGRVQEAEQWCDTLVALASDGLYRQ